jgi:hypothetical protein
MAMSLPVVLAHEVISRACLFRCQPLANDAGGAPVLSAGCCARRQAKARKAIGGDSVRMCRDCAVGKEVERLSGGPAELGEHNGKEEAARSRGGQNGTRTNRRRMAKRAAEGGDG